MTAGLFLGFDIGTQSTKAVVLDATRGTIVARASCPHTMVEGLGPGHVEQRPDEWIAAMQTTAWDVLEHVDRARIGGIGVSGQQHGCVVLDGDGAVVRPAKLWCDTATVAESEELALRLGRPVPVGFTASKLLWLARHEPANWVRVRTVLLPHDHGNRWLTGEASMEPGDASGTGFFDPVAGVFELRAMMAVDPRLPAMLPRVRAPGTFAGTLSARAAAALGLRIGIPVSTGGGDNMMSAIGSGATRPGVVVASLGTSGTIFTRTDRPVHDPRAAIASFCSSDGGWLPLLCVMNLTGVTEEVKALVGLDHDVLMAAAREVAPGSGGLVWLPFLVGERVPDLPLATGTLAGLRPGLLRPGSLYRAALEGTACNLASGLDRLRALGLAVGEVRLTGGGAKNPLWRQILADCFGVPVVVLAETETAALGAALQASWAVRRATGERDLSCDAVAQPFVQCGERVAPMAAHAAAYADLRRRFAALLAQLHP